MKVDAYAPGAVKLLKPGGVIYLSTMEDDHLKSGFKKGSSGDEMYLYYHEGSYLEEALKKNQFKVLSVIRQPFISAQEEATDLILIAENSKK